MNLRVHVYAACSSCRNALKFLDARKIAYEAIPIVEKPPGVAELRTMLGHLTVRGGGLKDLFNTSGALYREMGLSAKLPAMAVPEALALLSKHGKLIKRPFALSSRAGAVGFREAEWKKLFG
jgi:arsenate reductase